MMNDEKNPRVHGGFQRYGGDGIDKARDVVEDGPNLDGVGEGAVGRLKRAHL